MVGADTAWIIVATALVLFMTLPGLALFYGGLVRSRNVLSVFMHCYAIACVMSVAWFALGYSIAFGDGNAIWGGLGKAFLNGVTVGRNCLIGANTFLPEGKEIPDNSVVIGAPGKVVREATDKDRAIMARPVPGYVRRWPQYRDKLRPLGSGGPADKNLT